MKSSRREGCFLKSHLEAVDRLFLRESKFEMARVPLLGLNLAFSRMLFGLKFLITRCLVNIRPMEMIFPLACRE